MGILDSETACARCGSSNTSFDLYAADSEGCGLDVRTSEHLHWRCHGCGYEWPEPAPHLRKRDVPDWAVVDGAGS